MRKRKKELGTDARQRLSSRMDVAILKTMQQEVSDRARSIQIELKKVARQVGAMKKRVSVLKRVAVTILCMTDGSEKAARSYVGIHSNESMLEDATFVETTMSQVVQMYKDMTKEDQDALCLQSLDLQTFRRLSEPDSMSRNLDSRTGSRTTA